MRLTLGFSPCPNDCFIFDALVHNKIDTEGLQFNVLLDDVETLNKKALKGELDISKLSYHALAHTLNNYILLKAGSALGYNCGPILITNQPELIQKTGDNLKIAIPGKLTTANLLLSIAYPNLTNKKEYVFSEIEGAVLSGEVDAGLIIHENRFTYQEKGLKKIIDLGEYWDSLIHAPIPLGGIVIKRNIDTEIQQKVNRLIKKSVEYAFANPKSSMPYVKEHAQEMSEEVMKKHIALYVNDFSIDLEEVGINAVKLLFAKAKELNLIKFEENKIMID
ncbi:MAG: 1,4-dihydroxy-6-naphthoate synthase [Bacteroidota bacterium]|nr:1,4-dihydroxy-6-naphthoate synthase [Bacteroidota bacterium]MDP3146753.1 1,4-dihydroxy-6-naphthoate synthase [Bacteroidota bacterium]